MRCLLLCFLCVSVLSLAGCDSQQQAGVYDRVFAKNGMTFAAPYLNIRGGKEKNMRLTVWTNFVSDSSRCRGAFISEGRDTVSFYPGGTKDAKRAGAAKRMYEVLPGREKYELAMPMTLNDTRECTWRLQEVQMFITDPFIDNRTTELASFVMVDEAELAPFDGQYDILCQKQSARVNQLDCRHKVQNGKNVVVFSQSVTSDAFLTLNIRTSSDVQVLAQ